MIVVNVKEYHPHKSPKHSPLTMEEASGDYAEMVVEITTPEKSETLRFGDSYHDRGQDKAEAIVHFLERWYGKENMKYTWGYYSHGDEFLY